jgi:hypothetical protein
VDERDMSTNHNSALDVMLICDLPKHAYVISSTVRVHILKCHTEHHEYIQSLGLNKAEGKGESERNLLGVLCCERKAVLKEQSTGQSWQRPYAHIHWVKLRVVAGNGRNVNMTVTWPDSSF